MAAPRERTVVQVAYDDRFLYVAAFAATRAIPRRSARGSDGAAAFPRATSITIALDPRHDHLTGYVFITNPSGVQSDSSLFNDTREDGDYEAVWEVATSHHVGGMERRVPHSRSRKFDSRAEGERSIWGFQVRRDVRADR